MMRPLQLSTLLVVVTLVAVRPALASDLDLLTTSTPPNVVILFDNSGSMNHHLWDDDFNPQKVYPDWCGFGQAPTIAGSSCPGLGNPSHECPNNETALGLSGTFSYTCGGVTRMLYHDGSTPQMTRYSLNYFNWLYGVATPADLLDEPTQTRLQAAKEMTNQVVDAVNPDDGTGGYTENVRFGLSRFHASSPYNGGFVSVPVAPNNKNTVKTGVNNITGVTWTPLSESLVDIARYYAGTEGFGTYSDYDRNTTTGAVTASPPVSPIDVYCRKNFVIVVTDGEPTMDLNNHHGTDFTSSVSNSDLDGNECSTDFPDTCTDAPTSGRDDGIVYPSDGTDWLDDVAYTMYNTDFNSTLDGTQNVMTYAIGFTIDHPLLRETATNGDGSYFTTDAANVGALATQLSDALLDIIDRSTSFTAATVPSSRTAFGDGFYTAYFIPSQSEPFWEGRLECYKLDVDGSVRAADGSIAIDPATGFFIEPRNPIWDAGAELKTNSSRALYTTDLGARVDFNTTNVDSTDLDLGAGEISLYPNYPASGVDTLAELATAMVNYLHGQDAFDEDTDNDSSELRDVVMGDVFHSNPSVVGPPMTLLFNEEGYGVPSPSAPADPTFLAQFEQRDRVLYTGANDGMLHAFDAGVFLGDDPDTPGIVEETYYSLGTGDERFGYVPELLLDQIKYIPRNLPRTHYYVDGSPTVADVWLGDGTGLDTDKEPSEWATVLVVGFREGGEGYLALDVTDPSGTSAAHSPYPKLLWEYTHARLGDSWSQPVITRVKARGAPGSGDHCGLDDGDGDCREAWVAIFGGGYRDDGDPNLSAYIANPADVNWSDRSKAIFMVRLDTGQELGMVRFDQAGVAGPSAMKYSLPGSPAVLDLDFDGFADAVYIGDLGGQVWKWDISDVGEDTDADNLVDNWPAGVFFRTDPESMPDGSDHYRSFFYQVNATFHSGDLLLAFGTGERTDLRYPGDATRNENNRFYVVEDPEPTGALAFASTFTESDLTDITGLDDDPDPLDSGFYFSIADAEKFLTNPLIFAGFVITTSYLPDLVGADICSQTGTSALYIFDVFSGVGYFAGPGVTGDDARASDLGSGVPTCPKISISPAGDKMYIQTSDGRVEERDPPPRNQPPASIIYWKQNF
jgi:type IV pilus assembly protein PilY1